MRGNEQYTKRKVLRSNQHNKCRLVSTTWLLRIICSRWPPWLSMRCCLNFCNKAPLRVPFLFNITQNGYLSIMLASSCDVYLFGVTRPHLQPGDYRGTLVILEYVANIFGYATAKSERQRVWNVWFQQEGVMANSVRQNMSSSRRNDNVTIWRICWPSRSPYLTGQSFFYESVWSINCMLLAQAAIRSWKSALHGEV